MSRWPILLCSLLCASPAFAQRSESQSEVERIKVAADEYSAGRSAYKAGDYDVAAEHFEKADLAAPAPEALRMAIRARTDAGQPDRAATLAAAALARYPTDEATVELANETLKDASARLFKLTVHCDKPCSLAVGRRLVPSRETTDMTIYLEPGRHEIKAAWSHGREKSEPVNAQKYASTELSFEAPDPPVVINVDDTSVGATTEDVEDEKKSSGLPPYVFYSAVGVSAVLAGVTIWSGVDMRANPGKDKVRKDCVGLGESCPTYKDAISAQNRTNALLIVSGVVVAGTAVVGGFFTDWSGGSKDTSTEAKRRVVPTLSVGQGVVLGATGSF